MNALITSCNLWGARLLEAAVPMLLQSSLLILVLLLLDRVLRRHVRAVVRYALLLLVLVKLVLPPGLALPTGIGYWLGARAPKLAPAESAIPAAVPMVRLLETADRPAPPILPARSTPPSLHLPGVALLVWAAGILCLLGFLLHRARWVVQIVARAGPAPDPLQRLLGECVRQMNLRGNIRLKLSAAAVSPAVCGWWRPVILMPRQFPERLSASQMRSVLLHELAHVKRGDVWLNHAQTFLQLLYWWHPLVWLANAHIRRVREQAVDEAVMVAMGRDAEAYPATLVEVAKLAFLRPAMALGLVGILESKTALKQRITQLVSRPVPRTAGLGFAGLAAIVGLAGLLLPMAHGARAVAPVAQNAVGTAPSKPSPATAPVGGSRSTTITRLVGPLPNLDNAPAEVSLRPSAPGAPYGGARANDGSGRCRGKGANIWLMFHLVFDVVQSEVICNTPLPEGKYDFVANLPSGNQEAFQQLLKDELGLATRLEERETEMIVFRVKAANAPGLRPPTRVTPGSVAYNYEAYKHSDTSIGQMIRQMSLLTGRLMVDETGLTPHYSIDIRWDLPGAKQLDLPSFQQEVERELGLEAKVVKRPHRMLIVEKAAAKPKAELERSVEARMVNDSPADHVAPAAGAAATKKLVTLNGKIFAVPASALGQLGLGAAAQTNAAGDMVWRQTDPQLQALLRRLETTPDQELISSPRIATSDGVQANLFVGYTHPIDGAMVQIGKTLQVNPHVKDGQVGLSIRAAVQELVKRPSDGKESVLTNEMTVASVTLRDGESAVLCNPKARTADGRMLLFMVTPSVEAGDQSQVFPPGVINLKNADLRQVLDIYRDLAGCEPVLQPAAESYAGKVTLRTEKSMTRGEAINLIEQALREQAGVRLTRLDDKRILVERLSK